MSISRVRNHSKKANLKTFFNGIIEPLDDIVHVRAHIHRISFSTNYNYEDIVKKLGSRFQIKQIRKHSKSFHSIYSHEGFTNFKEFKIHVMTGLKPWMLKKTNRFSQISVVPTFEISPDRHKNLICELHNLFGNSIVKVNAVELAIDLMHISPDAVRRTFHSILNIIYVPYITRSNKIRFDGNQIQSGKKLNAVVKLGKKNKVYERGEDENRIPEEYNEKDRRIRISGWPIEDLDRIRLERTMDRRELKKLKIDTLHDLAQYRDEMGKNIMHGLQNHFQFKYIVKGEHCANYTCLMNTVVRMSRKSNYVLPIKRLKIRRLKRRIINAIDDHNAEWMKDKFFKKKPARRIRRRLKINDLYIGSK